MRSQSETPAGSPTIDDYSWMDRVFAWRSGTDKQGEDSSLLPGRSQQIVSVAFPGMGGAFCPRPMTATACGTLPVPRPCAGYREVQSVPVSFLLTANGHSRLSKGIPPRTLLCSTSTTDRFFGSGTRA